MMMQKIILIAEKNNLKSELVQKIKADIEYKEVQILSNVISKKITDYEQSEKSQKISTNFFPRKLIENHIIIPLVVFMI